MWQVVSVILLGNGSNSAEVTETVGKLAVRDFRAGVLS